MNTTFFSAKVSVSFLKYVLSAYASQFEESTLMYPIRILAEDMGKVTLVTSDGYLLQNLKREALLFDGSTVDVFESIIVPLMQPFILSVVVDGQFSTGLFWEYLGSHFDNLLESFGNDSWMIQLNRNTKLTIGVFGQSRERLLRVGNYLQEVYPVPGADYDLLAQ